MSVQIHCDNCDKSLDTHKPYANTISNTEPSWVRLFKDGHYGFDSGQNGWAFCDNCCAGEYFISLHYAREAQSAATEV